MHISTWGEEIIIRNTLSNDYLEVILAGITYPNPAYRIAHNISKQFPYDYYVFEYVVKGVGYIETPEEKFTVTEGDFYFLNKLCHHIYYSDPENPYEKIFIVLKGSFVDSLVSNYHLNESVYVKKCKLHSFMLNILDILKKESVINYDLLAVKVLLLFQQVFPAPYRRTQAPHRVAELVKNYIDNHITEKITLEDISKELFISKSHIERAFKNAYNQPPLAYCMNEKVIHVASMLITTNYSLTQIAQHLGFTDVKYMSRIFKKIKGRTPMQYKKEKLAQIKKANKQIN